MRNFDSFYTTVDKGYKTPCWIWTGAISKGGYGVIFRDGITQDAHRYSYSLVSQIAPGMSLDHLCKNKDCINPDHLEQVLHKINCRRGPSAKITQEIADTIRKEFKMGKSRSQLVLDYSIARRTINDVLNHKSWA